MASSIFVASPPILLVMLFHLLLQKNPTCFASEKTPSDLRLALTRVDLGENQPKNQFAQSFQSALSSPAQASGDLYITNIKIGTPPVIFSAVVDTGSDLIWTKCNSSLRLYDPSRSKSFFEQSCRDDGCILTYADGGSIKENMGRETLNIGGMNISNVTFACGTPIGNSKDTFDKYDGIVGMNRGDRSLVSQLKLTVFSYCLASRFDKSDNSILLFGSDAQTASIMSNLQTTPLLNVGDPYYYYMSLEGISVGETRLPVDKSNFAIKDNTGGIIIDSGTTFTYLEEGIIDMIENEFVKQTKLKRSEVKDPPYGLTRCFDEVKITPKLVFHFTGANWDLPRENYMYSNGGMLSCLAFIAKNQKDKVSIFGNMQQQNMMVLYDLDKNSLSFKPTKCNQH